MTAATHVQQAPVTIITHCAPDMAEAVLQGPLKLAEQLRQAQAELARVTEQRDVYRGALLEAVRVLAKADPAAVDGLINVREVTA